MTTGATAAEPSAGPVPHPVHFATTDPREAQAFTDRVCGARPGKPAAPGRTSPLAICQDSAGGLSSVDMTLPADLTLQVQGSDDLSVLTLLHGTTRARVGRGTERYRAGDVCLGAFPGGDYLVRCRDLRVGILTLPADALAQATAAALGQTRPLRQLRFATLRPTSPAAAAQWRRAAAYVRGILADDQTAANPLITGSAARLVATIALTIFPNNLLARQQRGTATPAAVRRAEEFIHAHAHRDIALADLAAAAHVSPRALQYAFARHHQMSPLAYLRQVRLARAHTDLLRADPTGSDTVTATALRWGFTHRGRFTTAYRQAYGELPSRTLRNESPTRHRPTATREPDTADGCL